MFKTFLTLFTFLIAPITAFAQTTEPSNEPGDLIAIQLPAPLPLQSYFPTIQGLTWTYGGNPRELATQIRMLETQDTDQGIVYQWNSFQGERWVQNSADGTVQEYHNGQWRLLFNFNAQEGESWLIESFGNDDLLNHATLTMVSRSEKLVVPYETIETIHISVKNENLADAGITDLWFASGLGLVKWSESTIAGPQSFELASFINRNEPPVVTDPTLPQPPIIIDLADYFPTRSGLIWEYAGSPLESARRIGISGIDRKEPPTYYLYEGFQGAMRVRKTSDGQIMTVTDTGEHLFLDLNAQEGASWTIEGNDDNLLSGSTVTVISRNARLEVPAGQFGNVLHLGIKPNPQLADAGVTEMWLAPGYGLVKWTEITFAGAQTYDLIAMVDPVQSGGTPEPGDSSIVIIEPIPLPFPEPDPTRPIEDYENRTSVENGNVKYELATTKASYTQGHTVEIQYRLTAQTGDATFKFNSGQQYDFHLTNEQNETAWVWSANKSFIFGETSLSLKQGESQSFLARIGLEYEFLPAGKYTLKAFMPTSDLSDISREQTQISLPVEITADPTIALVTGTVKDDMGTPVAALISLSENVSSDDHFGGTASATWTTRSGTFNIRSRAGSYTLTARADGYALHAQNIVLNAGENHIEITLKAEEKGAYTNANESVNKQFVTELATDRQAYRAGDKVSVRYRLTNISGQNLTLVFPSGQQYDLTLDGHRGRVWTWSQDKSFIQAFSTQTLKADDTFEIETDFILEDAWVQNNPSFLMTGFLTVVADQGGQVSQQETEAVVKFAIDGWVLPTPGRPSALSASIHTDQEFYKQGDIVTVSYKLTNTADTTVVLNFNSGQRYDIVLHAPNEAVWGWSWTRLFTAEIGELVLAPRDTFTFDEQIDLNQVPEAKDGVYVIRAYMTSTNEQDHDNTEAKTRFWLGDAQPVPPPIPLPVEPMPTRLVTHLDATFDAEAAQLSYRVVNTSTETIPLMFRSGQQFDFILTGPNGEIWRWSNGRGFDDALHAQTLSPGDSLVVQERVPLSTLTTMPDGTYTLQGFLTVTADDPEAAHQVETVASIKFSSQEGQILRTSAQPGSSEDASQSAGQKGDFDNNGAIDFSDFLNFAAAYGKTSTSLGYNATFDLDDDGTIGFSDFLTFAAAFGK